MNKKVSEVKITTDYTLFKMNELNRSIKKSKIKKLRPSIEKTKGNLQSILIDPKGSIIDGHHRFIVCKLLNLPVKYEVIDRTADSETMIEINNTSSGWVPIDYADHYAKKGNPNYQIFLKYKEQFPGLKDGVLCSILENKYALNDNSSGSMRKKGFQEETFIVMQENKSKIFLNHLKTISTFYKGWNRRAFVYALIHLSNNSEFIWEKFINKLKIRHISLFEYPKAEDFVKALAEIYNYRERKKVDFTI